MAGKELQEHDEARYGTFQPAKEAKVEPVTPKRSRFDSEMELQREYRGLERVRLALALVLAFTLVAVSVLAEQARNAEANKTTRLRGTTVFTAASASAPGASLRSVRVVYGRNTSDIRAEFYTASTTTATQVADVTAWASFNDSAEAISRSQLWVHTADAPLGISETTGAGSEWLQRTMFAAGYAEGALTHSHMDEHYRNVLATFFPTDEHDAMRQETLHGVRRFLQKNLDWTREHVRDFSKNSQSIDADVQYWKTVGALLAQFDGLVAGYQAFSERETPMSTLDLFLLNAQGDLRDLVSIARRKLQQQQQPTTDSNSATPARLAQLESSALLRVLPDFQDLLWSHTASSSSPTNHIFKHYDLPLTQTPSAKKPSARRQISLSSSPGLLSSPDAWYLTSAGLGVLATTHSVDNPELYALVTSHSVSSWLRASAANLLAVDGASWSAVFIRHNSGTGNGQWVVVDTHQFLPGRGFMPGGLMMLEQLPDLVHVEDLSAAVNAQGCWPQDNSACARVFRQGTPRVESYEALQSLLRDGDRKMNPLGGLVDAKVTSLSRAQRLEWHAASGEALAGNS